MSRSVSVLLVLCGLLAGCSSSGGGSSSGSGPSSSGSCTCNVTYNGVTKSIACGDTACINGEQFACGNGASEDKGACSAGSSSGGGSCGLFTCKSEADCGLVVCANTESGTGYCFTQVANAQECEAGTTAHTINLTGLNRTAIICAPSVCSSPTTYLP